MSKKAFLHFGGSFVGTPNGPFFTTETDFIEAPLWWHKQGLSFTKSGYGSRIPMPYKVRMGNRFHRVYCCIYGNSGTCFIEQKRKPVATVDIY
jgi:hypothetical protein